MQSIITDTWLAKSRAIHLSGRGLMFVGVVLSFFLTLTTVGLYHWVFLKGAKEGWPVIGPFVCTLVKDEFSQRDRFMRQNLDVVAQKLGGMQVKMTELESFGERVLGLASVNPAEIKATPGRDGSLVNGNPLLME